VAICAKCASQLKDGAAFCVFCGTPVAAATCGNCASELKDGAAFCQACGTPVTAAGGSAHPEHLPEVDADGRSTRAAIETLASRQLTLKLGIGREVKLLNEQLHPGEEVFRLAKASHGGKTGVLAVTNERVLWYHAAPIGRTLIDQRHDRISSVKAHKGVIGASLVVNAGGDEWTLRNVYPKEAVDQIAQVIRDEAQSRNMPVAVPVPPAQAPDLMDQLKKLGELRDAGVLTNEEFEAKKSDLLSRL
jgi:hypothetical protein